MQTTSVNICNLCIPCYCHCDYCLLSWDKHISGVSYDRSEAYARRIYGEIKRNRPELHFSFYCGYSMDHPHIEQMISFAKETASPSASFLQFNGMKMRNSEELMTYLLKLQALGITTIDLTLYGLQDHHDRFAGRKGDFDYLFRIMKTANQIGMGLVTDVALTAENASQINELVDLLEDHSPQRLSLFVPHTEGRGHRLDTVRFSAKTLELLNDKSRKYLNRNIYKTEAEWLKKCSFKEYHQRVLTVVLNRNNMDFYEQHSLDETVAYVERLDDDYYSQIPTLNELADCYGNPENQLFYRQRDLEMKYEKIFMQAYNLKLYDIHDETHCFVRHI